MDTHTFVDILGNFGFPIVISLYLLIRLEKKTDELVLKITKYMDLIDKER